jgi:tetratricopeptide (TPR) repeat protein
MRNVFFTILLISLIVSCNTSDEVTVNDADILKLEELLKTDSSQQNKIALIGNIFKKGDDASDAKQKENYFKYGIKACEKYGMIDEKQSFTLALINCCYDSKETPDRLAEVAESLKRDGKIEVAKVIERSIAKNFPNSSIVTSMSEEIKNLDIEEFIKSIGAEALGAEGSSTINEEAGRKYVDACEAMSIGDPKNDKTAEYLYKGGEMARSLGTPEKALTMYMLISNKYPKSTHAAESTFMSGFIFDSTFGNKDKATEYYQKFVSTYPDHALAKDAKFLLDNIDKSDEELIEELSKKEN